MNPENETSENETDRDEINENETNESNNVDPTPEPVVETTTYRPMSVSRSNQKNRSKMLSKTPSRTLSKTRSRNNTNRNNNTRRNNTRKHPSKSVDLSKKAFYILQDVITKTDKMNSQSVGAFLKTYFSNKKYGRSPLGDQLRSFVNSKLNQTKFITPGHHKKAIKEAVLRTRSMA